MPRPEFFQALSSVALSKLRRSRRPLEISPSSSVGACSYNFFRCPADTNRGGSLSRAARPSAWEAGRSHTLREAKSLQPSSSNVFEVRNEKCIHSHVLRPGACGMHGGRQLTTSARRGQDHIAKQFSRFLRACAVRLGARLLRALHTGGQDSAGHRPPMEGIRKKRYRLKRLFDIDHLHKKRSSYRMVYEPKKQRRVRLSL
jgi:hypothetical protein